MKILLVVLLCIVTNCYGSVQQFGNPLPSSSSKVLDEADRLVSENEDIQNELDRLDNKWVWGYGKDDEIAKELILKYKYNREAYNKLRKTKEGSSLYPMSNVHTCLDDNELPLTKAELKKQKEYTKHNTDLCMKILWYIVEVLLVIILCIAVYVLIQFVRLLYEKNKKSSIDY